MMKKNKSVLYLVSGRSTSRKNPGTKIKSILSCWEKIGFDVHPIFGGDLPGGTVDPEGDYGQSSYYKKWYRQIKLLSPFIRSVSELRDLKHQKSTAEYLTEIVSKNPPDLIWERSSRLHSAGLEVAGRFEIPSVLEWKDHLIPYRFSLFHHKAASMEKWKNGAADFIVVESGVLGDMLALEGVERRKLIVAHNAADPERFNQDGELRKIRRFELGISDKETLIGYLGSYAFYHDAVRLVRATDILCRGRVAGIRVLMIGNGEQYPECLAEAQQRGLIGGILTMGLGVPGHEVPAILSALDIAVLPGSTDIICPIKIQEYMAAGLPTIAPDYPCNREVITHGKTGMLFTPGDEAALAKTILELSRDRELRQHMGLAARMEVATRFTWEKTWGKTLRQIFARIES
jgi:glycosyltransferase involved in cell wall biosynthesis